MHVYQWHPYELKALLCGLGGGVIFGVNLHRTWMAWRAHRKDRRP